MKMTIRCIPLVVGLMATASVFAQMASSGMAAVSTMPTPDPMAATQLANLNEAFVGFDPFASSGSTSPILVVPAGQMSVEAISAANEDMNVMGRILTTALKQAGVTASNGEWSNIYGVGDMGSGWTFRPPASSPESLYVQGYGVLFTLKVGFPLSPGPDSNEPQKAAEKTGGDSVWLKAKEELYEPQVVERRIATGRRSKEEKYSAERVDSLKTAVLTALQHAANIRGLQPTDVIVVTVIGQSSRTSIVSLKTIEGTNDVVVTDRGNKTVVYKGGLPENVKQTAPTILTIRAKVSDVTAFNKGEINLEQFRPKVQILSHPYLGSKAGSTVSTSFVLPSSSQSLPPVGTPSTQP